MVWALAVALLAGACARATPEAAAPAEEASADPAVAAPAPAEDLVPADPPAAASPEPPAAPPADPPAPAEEPAPAPMEIAYRIEVRTPDPAVAGFPAVVEAVLSDPRGWSQAGFSLVRRDDAPFVVILAEGPEVDALCLPYDTYGQYSCQNGPVVALNADRWRHATPQWTGDLHAYRVMLVNHEVGHLLGQRHVRCPAPGEPAPVMAQQSTELRGCLPNPWPLPWEVDLAARREQPIAPGYGE